MDIVVTGASRGIGRALALALARRATPGDRIFALGRDTARLEALAREGGASAVVPLTFDLGKITSARAAGEHLAGILEAGAVVVHNAGVWPSRRELVDGLEAAFVTNCLAVRAFSEPLLAAKLVARMLVVSAGLVAVGRFDADRTPTGEDFSALRTYATTKLAGAVVMRDVARRHPEVDVAILHPGVVATDLGARGGLFGAALRFVKRRWETPETCAARLVRLLDLPRWQTTAGEAPFYVEEHVEPWPASVLRDEASVLDSVARHLGT